ncbi:hypothetical protein [Aliarcobacter cryaerophilus]|uniref:hypothetical protein n=1 Tax=Aliarcobacter cryaerophilus TaxID=28198 RepID=UPI00112F30DE|nr:hypothetical protein [Aliarcobacter cryaerophilus]
MTSNKTCIICSNIANSREHIFPAAFGGRVVNKSIYCSFHNCAYSRHVDSLDKELDILNSAIGVIPDRKKSIKETRLKDSASEEYVYTKDYMKLASPSALDMAPNSGAEQMQLRFADHMQAQKWMDEQKKRGYEFKNTSYGKVTKTMFVEPMKKTMDLGNDKFMLGVLYIALTFLAHHYPHIARAKELQSVKDILNNDEDTKDIVLWESSDKLDLFGENPFEFGHIIAIGKMKDTNKIGAIVSFFGRISFAVNLAEPNSDILNEFQTIVSFINPLEKDVKKSIATQKHDLQLNLSTTVQSKKYLNSLKSGKIKNPIEEILSLATTKVLNQDMENIYNKLQKSIEISSPTSYALVVEILSEYEQRILNLITYTIDDFCEFSVDLDENFKIALKQLIKEDENGNKGLNELSFHFLELVKQNIAYEVHNSMVIGSLTTEFLVQLFAKEKGVYVVMNSVFMLMEGKINFDFKY